MHAWLVTHNTVIRRYAVHYKRYFKTLWCIRIKPHRLPRSYSYHKFNELLYLFREQERIPQCKYHIGQYRYYTTFRLVIDPKKEYRERFSKQDLNYNLPWYRGRLYHHIYSRVQYSYYHDFERPRRYDYWFNTSFVNHDHLTYLGR